MQYFVSISLPNAIRNNMRRIHFRGPTTLVGGVEKRFMGGTILFVDGGLVATKGGSCRVRISLA